MNRIEYRIVGGLLAVVIGFAPVASPAAADIKNKTDNKTGQVRAKSSSSADAPLLGRIVVTPTPEQVAKIRIERRMKESGNRAADSRKHGNGLPPGTGAS
jgi:hypothetical protein